MRSLMAASAGPWPGAEELVRELVTVPTHSLVTAAEREEVLRAVNSYPG